MEGPGMCARANWKCPKLKTGARDYVPLKWDGTADIYAPEKLDKQAESR